MQHLVGAIDGELDLADWEKIGKVWVDSGQIIIADPCYVLSQDDYSRMDKTNHPLDFKQGIVNSGWGGDGNFPVCVKRNKKGLIMEMKIIFNREPMECGCSDPDEICNEDNR